VDNSKASLNTIAFSKAHRYGKRQHTVLLANKSHLPFSSPVAKHHRPIGWYLFYCHTEGRRLSRPRWLVTYRNKVPPRESNPDTVTYPSTNRAQRRLTSLIETNALPLRQTANSHSFTPWLKTHLFHTPFPS